MLDHNNDSGLIDKLFTEYQRDTKDAFEKLTELNDKMYSITIEYERRRAECRDELFITIGNIKNEIEKRVLECEKSITSFRTVMYVLYTITGLILTLMGLFISFAK